MDAAERELQAAVTALQGRDGRSGRGAFARRIVMKGGRLCDKGADERRSRILQKKGLFESELEYK